MANSTAAAFDASRYSHVESCEHANSWLRIQSNLGLAHNTLKAYGRALNDFLAFTSQSSTDVTSASREHVSAWVRDLLSRHKKQSAKSIRIDSGAGLSNATLQQRITAVRLFYDFLIEEGMRSTNPVGLGVTLHGKASGPAVSEDCCLDFTSCRGFLTMCIGMPSSLRWRRSLCEIA